MCIVPRVRGPGADAERKNLDLERGIRIRGEGEEIEHGADDRVEGIQNHWGGIMPGVPRVTPASPKLDAIISDGLGSSIPNS